MMKNICSALFMFVMLVIMSTIITACQYKEFDEYDGTVPVKTIADYKGSGCKVFPVISRVCFYPIQSPQSPYFFDIKDSMIVNLPTGQIQAFAYNNNSEINRTRVLQGDKTLPIIFTGKADCRGIYKKDSVDHTVYYDYPDITYSAWRAIEIVGNGTITKPDDNRFVLSMKTITRPAVIEVCGIKNASFLSGVRMSLSGIQQDYSPIDGFTPSYVDIVADGKICTTDPDKGNRSVFDDKNIVDTLQAYLNVFGVGKQKHELRVFLDGGNWHKVLTFDVTKQLNDQSEGKNAIHIVVETDHNIKDDIPVQGGVNISISGWEEVTSPIDMH